MRKFYLTKIFSKILNQQICQLFLKRKETFVKKYRLVSARPTVSKIFERIMQKQISDYIEKFFSQFLFGYIKGFSTPYALLRLIKRWNFSLDKQSCAGTLLMDLSKVFDTINHELTTHYLIAHAWLFY